jgi:NADPH2:quinone reductase
VVVERGPDATDFAVGDRVIVIKFSGGCSAERVAASPRMLLSAPAALDFEQLAAFPIVFGTAWYALHEIARVRPGESVLIQAAAGGVGTAAIQLARSHGCKPILGTAGGPEKTRLVESLGASAAIDYRAEGEAGDFRPAVLEATGGRGVDFVLESVGGDVFQRSLEVLAPMGRMVVIGFSSIREDYKQAVPKVHPLSLFHRSTMISGLNVENLDIPTRRDVWARLVRHVDQHDLRPVIGHRFPLEQAAEAHAALEGRRTHGKVLLVP